MLSGWLVLLFLTSGLSAQTSLLDSASSRIFLQLKQEAKNSNPKKLRQFFNDNRMAIRYDAMLFDTSMNFLLALERPDLVNAVLQENPFLMSQHNELSLYYYYRGVSQMLDQRGWPNYKLAERSLRKALIEIRRSQTPDYGFFSDVHNAHGYLSITARGHSSSRDKDKRPICVVRPDFIYMAIDHFREALTYNPENEYAQGNLDTLYSKLELAGLPIPPEKIKSSTPFHGGLQIAFDSLNLDSLHNTSRLPILDYNLLPKDYHLILQQLSTYDEIVLCLDLSGSMDESVGWGPETSKFKVAQQLSLFLALNLRKEAFVGAVSVGQDCDMENMVLDYSIASVSREAFAMKLDAIAPYGHTPLNQRLQHTATMFSSRKNKKLVFLLSDGMDTCNDLVDLCGTAASLAAQGIDLSVFSFIYESLDPVSRTAYSIYECLVRPSEGKIYKITEDGGVEDEIDYEPVSNNTLVLPPLDSSGLWSSNPILFQFEIEGVVPPVREILKLE